MCDVVLTVYNNVELTEKCIASINLHNQGLDTLIIVDNGEGISDEIKEKIFEINFTTKEKGMGLGLKLARRFLEGVNGKIHLVQSGSSGTTFEITIPKYNSSENV